MSNQSGTGGGHPSQDQALIKTRREVKQLEEALCKEADENNKLRKENERLKQENEKLKEELAASRQVPKWVKANRSEQQKKKAKKKGSKPGHAAHPRILPKRIDREVGLLPKHCPNCRENLPEPSKWHTHTQIDLSPPSHPIVTRFHVGWSYCKNCQKEVSIRNRLSGSNYGPKSPRPSLLLEI